MSKSIEKRSDYDQAIGSTQQHVIDVSKFLADGETVTHVDATHIPRNADDEDAGTPGTVDVGIIVDGVIPINLTIPEDNSVGIHIVRLQLTCASPDELPIFRVLVRVPF